MKNTNKLDNLMEELSCEPRSPDYDSVLSSMLQIDSKARSVAEGYGVPAEQIYKAIDFHPKGFVSEFGSDADGSDFAYSDVMRDLQVLEEHLVPEQDSKYGGIRMPEFMRNDRAEASFPLPGKEKPVPVGGVKKGEVVLKEKMGIFDYVANFIRKHPKLSAAGGIALLFGFGYATNDTVKDKTVKWAKDKAGNAVSAAMFGGAPPVAFDNVVPANASVAATPTPDYYDPDFKVGIVIEGDDGFKRNVTNLIKTFKEVTPDDYADLIKYAPKKIVRSPDSSNWYGGPPDNDLIQLAIGNEIRGGSDDFKARLSGVPDLVAEMGNAKRSKTGVRFNNTYESELDANVRSANYGVKVGLWTQENANRTIKSISERLKAGTYYNGDTTVVDNGKKYLPSD